MSAAPAAAAPLLLVLLVVTAVDSSALLASAALVPSADLLETEVPISVCQFGLVELSVPTPPPPVDTAIDPAWFDSAAVPVAQIAGPGASRRVTVRTFLYQNFTRAWVDQREVLAPLGDPVFLLRFAPPTIGGYNYSVAQHDGTVVARGSLQVVACPTSTTSGGFVRTSPSGQHFVGSGNGASIFPVGENVAMPDRTNGTYAMEHYLDRLLTHDANAFRLWLGPSMVDNNIGWPAWCDFQYCSVQLICWPISILMTKRRMLSLNSRTDILRTCCFPRIVLPFRTFVLQPWYVLRAVLLHLAAHPGEQAAGVLSRQRLARGLDSQIRSGARHACALEPGFVAAKYAIRRMELLGMRQ